MADPRDFLLNTDYEMDKIVYFKDGDMLPDNTYVDDFDLGFTPLVFAAFSFTEDFSDTKMNYAQYGTAGTDEVLIEINARSDGVVINYKNDAHPDQKLYYRIYGFEPTTSTANLPSTQNKAKEFILNTDYNYCKLYEKGVANENTTITHNLGYIPLVLAWEESPWTNPSPNIVNPCFYSGAEDSGIASVNVTTSSVTITGVQPNHKVHYRIYYDEV